MRRHWIWLVAASGCTPASRVDTAPIDLNSLHEQLLAYHAQPRWGVDEASGEAGWFSRTEYASALLLPDRLEAYHPGSTDPAARITLATAAYGRGEALALVPAGNVYADEFSFESRRPGLTEWVQTSPDQLEHGYTLHRRPPGEGPVVIEIEVSGGVPRAIEDGAVIRFAGQRERLRWDGLVAWDARGAEVSAETSVHGQRIRVEIDDTNAQWPLTVDPTILVSTGLDFSAGNTTSGYGFAIDSEGDQLVVGAPFAGDGKAQVVLPGPDAGLDVALAGGRSEIGTSVAIEGHWAVLGSPGGVVQIFDHRSGGWELAETLTDNGAVLFGASLEISDNLLIIGTPADGLGGIRVYNSYVEGLPHAWDEAEDVTFTGLSTGAELGAAVAAADGWLAVGAPGADRVAMLRRRVVADQVFSQTALLSPVPALDSFGSAVSMWGDRVAVGAPLANTVQVYENTAVDLVDLTAPLADTFTVRGTISPPFDTDGFGASVAVFGDTLAVTDQPAGRPAMVYVYEYVSPSWQLRDLLELEPDAVWTGTSTCPITLTETLLAVGVPEFGKVFTWNRQSGFFLDTPVTQSGAMDDAFGTAVALDADLLAIGAPKDITSGSASSRGSVSLFSRSSTGTWVLSELISGITGGSRFGSAVALDSPQLAVGAPGANEVSIYISDTVSASTGTVSAATTIPAIACTGGGGEFGSAVALDAAALLVGAPYDNADGITDSGSACFYAKFPNLSWLLQDRLSSSLALITALANDRMGTSVALSNGRAYISSERANGGRGRVEVYESLELPAFEPVTTLEGGANERLGSSISVSGDLLAVGAPGFSTDDGVVKIYQIGVNGAQYDLVGSIAAPGGNQQFGHLVSFAGNRLATANRAGANANLYLYEAENADVVDTWNQIDSVATASFATSIALSDDLLAAGFPDDDNAVIYTIDAEGPPVARDDTFTIAEDSGSLTATSVLLNDTDPDGDTISITSSTSATTGLLLDTNGFLSYTPPPNFSGDVTLDYTITAGGKTSTATVTIHVTSMPDAPIAAIDPSPTTFYQANVGTTTTIPANLGVLANDTDADFGDALTAEKFGTWPAWAVLNADGSLELTPVAYGTYITYQYRARDSTGRASDPTTVRIQVINQLPVAPTNLVYSTLEDTPKVQSPPGLLGLDENLLYDPEGEPLAYELVERPTHGLLTLTDIGAFIYSPEPNYFGPDFFILRYSEANTGQEAANTTRVDITVTEIDDAPVGLEDGPFQVPSGGELRLDADDLLSNDSDADQQSLSLELALDLPPTHGTFVVDGNDYVYTPEPYYEGPDTAWYRAKAGGAESEPVAVLIDVFPVNDPPLLGDSTVDLGLVTEAEVGNLVALAGIVEPDGETFTVLQVSPPLFGELTLAVETGAFTYTPFPGTSGEDRFLFVATDISGLSSEVGEVVLVVQTDPIPDGVETTTDGNPCVPSTWYLDSDGDGQGDAAIGVEACQAPAGYVADARDCDDRFADIFDGAPEIPRDGIDQDCDTRDNDPVPAGACSTTGARPLSSLVVIALAMLLRRRGAR